MGILDQIKGPVLQEILGFVKNQEGGLGGLVNKLKNSDIADQLASWIGMGDNKPVDSNQISSALGNETIKDMAAKLGLSEEETAKTMADALPEVVNQLTPNGKVEEEQSFLEKGISALKNLFN